jgi:uncharacterized protein YjbJ (UPF0337 family)
MKTSTKNEINGKLHEAKGKAIQVAGVIADDPALLSEGELEKLRGKLQQELSAIGKKLEK